jgi:hypothetical protein
MFERRMKPSARTPGKIRAQSCSHVTCGAREGVPAHPGSRAGLEPTAVCQASGEIGCGVITLSVLLWRA